MTTLSSQVAYVRAQSELWMLDHCLIKQYTGISNVDGAYEDRFTTVSGIPCRIVNKAGGTVINTTKQQNETQFTVSTLSTRIQLPYTVNVTVKDLIIFNNETYSIVDVPIKHALMGAFIVTLEKVV